MRHPLAKDSSERADLSSGLEVLAAHGNGHRLHLALLYAKGAVYLRPAHERRVLEVGPVVGTAGLKSGFDERRAKKGDRA